MYKKNYFPLPVAFICFILTLLLLFIWSNDMNENHIIESRENQNMILIEEGFVYDIDTKIIYKEYISGRTKYSYDSTFYTPYVSEEGNYYRYEKGEWIELDGE